MAEDRTGSGQMSLTLTSNQPPYTVSEISHALKRTVESAFGSVRVRGEVTQPKLANTGHLYFSLKDEDSVLDGVCWRTQCAKLNIVVEAGMDVICTGRLTTYPGRSRYQLVVETIELAGEGALLKLLEMRKRTLAAEGLFDASRKRKLPFIPDVIGVVTSPSGAVIHDILHRLSDRFPRRVLVWPVAVQGPGAAEQIAGAIAGFNRLEAGGNVPRPDLLIVARGGGSLEDLMAFNEEITIRAIAASTIPIIAAIGHETDTTLSDYAADIRAPTPTAAAEFAVPVRSGLIGYLAEIHGRLANGTAQAMERRRGMLQALARGLADPRRVLETASQTLDDRGERLCKTITARLKRDFLHLGKSAAALKHPRDQVEALIYQQKTLGERLTRAISGAGNDKRIALARADRLDASVLTRQIAEKNRQVAALGRHLEAISYHKVLDRGFVVVRDGNGSVVTDGVAITPGQTVNLEFRDETRTAKILPQT